LLKVACSGPGVSRTRNLALGYESNTLPTGPLQTQNKIWPRGSSKPSPGREDYSTSLACVRLKQAIRGLRHGMPMRELVTAVCAGMRGDAGQMKQCVPCRAGENFETLKIVTASL